MTVDSRGNFAGCSFRTSASCSGDEMTFSRVFTPGSLGQSSGIRKDRGRTERTRKEKPPTSGGDILAGDVAGLFRHIEPFGSRHLASPTQVAGSVEADRS
jgi:hypothetical protein